MLLAALAALVALAVGLTGPLGIAAQTLTAGGPATVTITDTGFSPAAVTVPLGGTVVWQNQGRVAHNVTTVGGAPTAFGSPGVGPGGSTSFQFSVPGNYYYTSGMDCRRDKTPGFDCTVGYLVTVLGANGAAPTPTPGGPPPLPSAIPGQHDVTVGIDDVNGFTPPVVTIPSGGSVTWKNLGQLTHNAQAISNPPANFNTAGIGPGATASMIFAVPGSYFYTSTMDCVTSSTPGFPCSASFIVNVTGADGALPTPTPLPGSGVAAPAGPSTSAAVDITDTTFSPPVVWVYLNGSVTFTNRGSHPHSATILPPNASSMPAFDSGGLGQGQSYSLTFNTAGTYVYSSAPDCIGPDPTPGFNCSYYAVIVSSAPAVAPTPVPATPTPTPLVLPGVTTAVAIDDVTGFQPPIVTVKPNQPVTWMNAGNKIHSVVVNTNPLGVGVAPPVWLTYSLPTNTAISFDSGGLAHNQTYTFVFNSVGTYPYHSSTEPIYNQNDPNCGCSWVTYQFYGQVNVQL